MQADSKVIFKALDSAGLRYDIKYTNKDLSYASFRWEYPPASSILRSFTILYDGRTLRISLHEPSGVGAQLSIADCLKWQDEFPIARLYTNSENTNKLELCIAISVAELVPDAVLLTSLMAHLSHNADTLLGANKLASIQAPSLVAMSPEVSLGVLLQKLGLHANQQQGAFVICIDLPELELSARMQIYHLGTGWLRVGAHLLNGMPLHVDKLPEELINQLQLWAPIGRFTSTKTEQGKVLGCEVAAVFMHREPGTVLAQAIKDAMLLLGSAHQHIQEKS